MLLKVKYFKMKTRKRTYKYFKEGLESYVAQNMLQRLPIALTQIKVGNISEDLLNEIRQIIYSLYREKEVSKKQGRSKGTSNIAFEVLIISCQIYLINLFIFNCLTLNINLFIFNLFDVKFSFSKNPIFQKQKRTAVYGLASLVSDFKLTQKNDDMLFSRHK